MFGNMSFVVELLHTRTHAHARILQRKSANIGQMLVGQTDGCQREGRDSQKSSLQVTHNSNPLVFIVELYVLVSVSGVHCNYSPSLPKES